LAGKRREKKTGEVTEKKDLKTEKATTNLAEKPKP